MHIIQYFQTSWLPNSPSLSSLLFFATIFLILELAYIIACFNTEHLYRFLHHKFNIGQYINNKPLRENQRKFEFISGSVTTLINTLIIFILCHFIIFQQTLSITQLLLDVVIATLVYDLSFYVLHRILHLPGLSNIHHHHHLNSPTTPWACISMHPVEAILLQLPLAIFMVFYQMNIISILLANIWFLIGTAHGHSNFDVFGHFKHHNWVNRYNRFHQLHHQKGKGNYGFLGTHWDRLFNSAIPNK